ncbi:MAG TPA: hypothetical protein VFN80_12025 [Acidothermaceae bacterium]|nr:hypothetical protein [Acidothermaceae bacterium]
MTDDELRTWQVRDPAALLRDIDGAMELRPGVSLLALVEDAPRTQELQRVTPISVPVSVDWYDDVAGVGVAALQGLGLEQWERRDDPAHWPTVVPVIVRSGRCVVRRGDLGVMRVLRYVNGFDAFTGDPLLVTPFGWCDVYEKFGGASPTCRVPVAAG